MPEPVINHQTRGGLCGRNLGAQTLKLFASLTLSFLLIPLTQAQSANPLPLWPEGAPGALGTNTDDIPTITAFLPATDKATGAAILICPGGGYEHLAPHEGKTYALWLNDHGVAAFVLKYRLAPKYHHPCMQQDVTRALRLVRAQAGQWNLDPHRIGIIGSSAGGHLASTLLTHFDAGNPAATDPVERQSSRPDLGVLCYPVITMGEHTHGGSKRNLLGEHPSPGLVDLLSNERHVSRETPPCFLYHSAVDNVVPVENSLEFAAALRRAGVPFDLHIYATGSHGVGLGGKDYDPAQLLPWTKDCLVFLKLNGFVK